jgi:hypothetical protein
MSTLASDLWVVYRHQVLPETLTEHLPRIDQGWGSFATVDADTDGGAATTTTAPPGSRPFDRDVILQTLGTDRNAAFDAFIANLHTTGGPTLDFMHVLLPHAPWQYLPDGAQYTNAGAVLGLEKEVWDTDEWTPITSYQRHLVQAQYVDGKIGALLDRLEAAGTLDESVIVLTADHGVSFVADAPRRRIVPESFGGVGYVPMFMKAPGQRDGVVDDTPRETVDVFPTLADMLDLDLPEGYDGISALDPDPPEREARMIANPAVELEPWPLDNEALLEIARRKDELFGPPDAGPYRFYGVGPYRDLIGKDAAALVTGDADAALEVAVENRDSLRGVQRGAGLWPSYLIGMITENGDAPREPIDLAVAVNGTIAGMTRSYTEEEGGKRWAAFLAPSTFVAGDNRVEVFAIVGERGSAHLERLRDAGLDGSAAAVRGARQGGL